jgi:UDP-3-O-[3-hydroxymyristoyl] glucosamine N-acyltransferase
MSKIRIFGKGGFAREWERHMCEPCDLVDSREAEPNDTRQSYIAIGDPHTREAVYNANKEKCITYPMICPGAQITVNVQFGLCVIVNLNATIGHDCVIGDFVTISPGANISGNVLIGNRCYIGTQAAIVEGVAICGDVILGAGAVVVEDITEPGTYVGVPAKRIK